MATGSRCSMQNTFLKNLLTSRKQSLDKDLNAIFISNPENTSKKSAKFRRLRNIFGYSTLLIYMI